MKQLIIFALVLLASTLSVDYAYGDTPEYAPKHVIIRERGTLIEDRSSLSDVQVCLYGNILQIESTSIGDADIYIVDSWGNVLAYDRLDVNVGHLMMSAPDSAGSYTIVIWSDIYYGEGSFTIE